MTTAATTPVGDPAVAPLPEPVWVVAAPVAVSSWEERDPSVGGVPSGEVDGDRGSSVGAGASRVAGRTVGVVVGEPTGALPVPSTVVGLVEAFPGAAPGDGPVATPGAGAVVGAAGCVALGWDGVVVGGGRVVEVGVVCAQVLSFIVVGAPGTRWGGATLGVGAVGRSSENDQPSTVPSGGRLLPAPKFP